MTVERHIELQDRLREVLGEQPAATLWSMLPGRDDLATKTDLSELEDSLRMEMVEFRDGLRGEIAGVRGEITDVREELKGEISNLRGDVSELRTDVSTFRTEMMHGYATKDDLFTLMNDWNESMRGYVRTFIVVQAATVVGMSTILFGLLRFF